MTTEEAAPPRASLSRPLMRRAVNNRESNSIPGAIHFLLMGLLVVPSTSIASDFTPLIWWFVEIPIFGLSFLFLLVCFSAPRAGIALSISLFLGSLFVLEWASDGYLEDGGELLLLSLLVDMAGIVVALKKIDTARQLGSSEDT